MAAQETTLRIGTPEDGPAIETLMRVSGDVLFRRFYDQHQAESAVRYVSTVDPLLLDDGTYFVIEAVGELVACGGWSRRDRLYTGSGDSEGDARLLDPATEPARVRAMFTRADWTRRGLGRRILEACEGAAAPRGLHASVPDGDACPACRCTARTASSRSRRSSSPFRTGSRSSR